MITRINWRDGKGNSRQDVVLATFYYEDRNYAVIAFNDFTVIKYDNSRTRSNIIDEPHYMELYT